MKILKMMIKGMGLAVIMPISFVCYMCEDIWDWAVNDSVPLSSCKDPEERKRGHRLILGATAGLHGIHGEGI